MRTSVSRCTVLAIATAMLCLPGCGTFLWPPSEKLDEIAAAIEGNLQAMDADLALAATEIARTGLDSSATRATLSTLCARYPNVLDCATIDPRGTIVAVEPVQYHSAEGADISDQAQVVEVIQEQHPVISTLFTAVEGMPALDFEYPLLADQTYLGSVSMLLKPADYFADLIGPLIEETGYLCMVLQLDGVILYDLDPSQVGRDTFNDPMFAEFPSLLEVARLCVSTSEGVSSYQFSESQTGRAVTKYARWTTVEFHGTQWRILLINEGFAAQR